MKRGCPEHPKTALLAFGLSLPIYSAVGLLEMLWHFTAKYAPAGDVGKWSDAQIANALKWDRDPSNLIGKMIDCGFLDTDDTFRLVVHDWHEHADEAVRKFLKRNHKSFCLDSVSTRPALSSGRVVPAVAVARALPEPLPEPVPLPEDERGVETMSDSEWESFADEVWQAFLAHSGQRGTRLMSPGEFSTLKGWRTEGIPLRVILRGIADTRGSGRMLGYYNSSVRQAYENWRQAVPA